MIAIDVDLGKITATMGDSVLCDRAAEPPTIPINHKGVILCEIAGPVMHSADGRDACPPGKRRWMLYNMGWIAQLAATTPNVLVATSTAWTRGFKLEARHALAGMIPLKHTKAGNPVYKYPKDIRETFAMQYMYTVYPQAWKPLAQYLKELL